MAAKEGGVGYAPAQSSFAGLLSTIKETLLLPVRLLTSKVAIRAYITSILFFITGLILFGFAVLSYLLFYWSYIPQIGFTRQIHMQYDLIPIECRAHISQQLSHVSPQQPLLSALTGPTTQTLKGELSLLQAAKCAGTPPPWGTAPVTPEVITQQAYDVVVELHLPNSPTNTEAGPFMLDARLLATTPAMPRLAPYTNPFDPVTSDASRSDTANAVVAHTRIPTTLPYRSPLLTLASSAMSLPRWTLGLETDVTHLRVQLFTGVSFPRERRGQAPSQIHLQLLSPVGRQVQVYSLTVHFRARFEGLRWVMYNFRFVTGAVFVGMFFAVEVVAALIVYGVLQFVVFGGSRASQSEGGKAGVKEEEGTETERERLSEAERTFPSYGGQEAMRYHGTTIKREDVGEGPISAGGMVAMTPGPGGEADDEDDEDADYVLDDTAGRWRDSGMGTSMESGREAGIRRRRSRGSSRDGGGLR